MPTKAAWVVTSAWASMSAVSSTRPSASKPRRSTLEKSAMRASLKVGANGLALRNRSFKSLRTSTPEPVSDLLPSTEG